MHAHLPALYRSCVLDVELHLVRCFVKPKRELVSLIILPSIDHGAPLSYGCSNFRACNAIVFPTGYLGAKVAGIFLHNLDVGVFEIGVRQPKAKLISRSGVGSIEPPVV